MPRKQRLLTDCLQYAGPNVPKYEDDQYYLSRHIEHTPPRLHPRQMSTCLCQNNEFLVIASIAILHPFFILVVKICHAILRSHFYSIPSALYLTSGPLTQHESRTCFADSAVSRKIAITVERIVLTTVEKTLVLKTNLFLWATRKDSFCQYSFSQQ